MTTTLSIAIPSYNESTTLESIISSVAAQKDLVRQIIVVNDGSTDRTTAMLDTLQRTWSYPSIDLQVIHFQENRGKGAAVQAAINVATQPYFLIQDADLELDPQDYASLVQPIDKGETQVVFGNRFPRGFPRTLGLLSRLANWIVTSLSNALYGLALKDQACGYKLFPTSLIREFGLVSNGFEICSEIAAKAGRRKISVVNVPVRYEPRDSEHGKKIRWMDGFTAVYTLLKYRL